MGLDFKKLTGAFKDPKKIFRIMRSPRAIVGIMGLTFAFGVYRWGARVITKGGTRLWIAIGILVIAIIIIIISKKKEKKKKRPLAFGPWGAGARREARPLRGRSSGRARAGRSRGSRG